MLQDTIVSIYGKGGHASVLKELLGDLGHKWGRFYDDADPQLAYKAPVDVKSDYLVIGIGNNQVRHKIAQKVVHPFITLIHPSAKVSPSAIIGEGSVILAGAAVQANAIIGKHVIVNVNAVIDHDAKVGDFASVYPGAYIAGGARVEDFQTVQANTVITKNQK